jgi:hypothetical protein
MAINLLSDSDGYSYQVWAQEQANSCAVASIWMARGQARQMSIDQDEWSLAWNIYSRVVQGMQLVPTPPAGRTFDPASHPADQNTFGDMFASFGTYMDQVAQAMSNEGLKTSKTAFSPGITVVPNKLADDKPAIVLLGWYSGGTRNGGHFIVASRKNSAGQIVYLDPWQGRLREMGPGPGYPGGGRFEQVLYVSA